MLKVIHTITAYSLVFTFVHKEELPSLNLGYLNIYTAIRKVQYNNLMFNSTFRAMTFHILL